MNEGFNKCHREIKKKKASLFCFHSSNIEAKTALRAKTASSVMVFGDSESPGSIKLCMVRANCLTFVTGGKITDAAAPFLLL